MTEFFDMNMNDLFGEDSEFIEGFRGLLEGVGIDIDASSLAKILHEYEMAKMEFLQIQIMQMLESQGEIPNGPVKVVVSQSGIDFQAAKTDFDYSEEFDDLEPTDSTIFS